MAQVITDQRTVVVKPWWARVRIFFIGAGLGLIWWVITALLRNYIIEPLACRDLSTATACVDSIGVAGNIAAVIIAIISVFILIRTFQPRPIIIAVASAAVLWGLGTYINGLAWYEALLWGVLLYALAYTLFSFVSRMAWLLGSIVVAVVIVLVIRILLIL